jgi:hypothetical protein
MNTDLEANLYTVSVSLEPIIANNVRVEANNIDNDKCFKFIKLLGVILTLSTFTTIIGALVIWYATSL